MSSTTADAAVKSGMTREEKFVIFASSLGTIFEWYDFYLYAVLAPFFAALFFPAGKRHGGAAVGLRDLRRGLPHPSVRRADLRTHRRPRRPQVHLPCHDHRDGRIDLPGRRAADLHRHRLARADPAGDAAAVPGPRARRRIRRRGDIRGRALPAWASAAMPRAGFRPRPRLAFCSRSSSSGCAASTWTPRSSPNGAGAFRSSCQSSCWCSRSTSGCG